MSSIRTATGLSLLLVTLLHESACSRPVALPAGVQLAIGPVENLTGDAGLDWMQTGLAYAVQSRLGGRAVVVTDRREADARGLPVLAAYFRRGGQGVEVHGMVEGFPRGPMLLAVDASGLGAIDLAARVSRSLDPAASAVATQSEAALREFALGLGTGDGPAAAQHFEAATRADPHFAAAYLAWAERSALFDPAALERIGTAAAAGGIAKADQVRLDAIRARVRGDRLGESLALEQLAEAVPSIEQKLVAARAAVRAARYGQAAALYRGATDRDGGRVDIWNELGYAEAYAGNLNGALYALDRYRQLQPNEPNPHDSKGEALFYLGQFTRAGSEFESAYAANPTFLNGLPLLKAAYARLFDGDLASAEQTFLRYEAARAQAGDAELVYRQAAWWKTVGRRAKAITLLEQARDDGQRNGAVRAGAAILLALMESENGHDARGPLQAALALARTDAAQSTVGVANVALLVGEAGTALERRRKVELAMAAAPVGQRTLVLALEDRFHQDAADGMPLWRDLAKMPDVPVTDTAAAAWLWAAVESGHATEAQSMAARFPVPVSTQLDLFAIVRLPAEFETRATLALALGRTAEARKWRELAAQIAAREK